MKIAERVKKVSASSTLELTAQAKRLKEQGQAVVNFGAGEPDFDTPAYIKESAIKAIQEGFTKYTPSTGCLELKQVICQKLEQDNQLHYLPSQIIVSSGAKHALYNILQVLCERKDEVIIASPYWVSYPEMVKLSEAEVRFVPTQPENKFKLDIPSLAAKITKRTKMLILNSPANPTGSVYTCEELKEIARLAIKHNFYVISDEIYEKIIFEGKKHISIASLNKQIYERTIVVNGVSKTYAMTGWRIGYLACADEEIIKAISNLQDHSTSNPCSISQRAAWEALKNSKEKEELINKMIKEFQARRDCMLEGLSKASGLRPLKPEGAFYLFCSIAKTGLDSLTFAQRLLKEALVAVIPGEGFGRDDYIRLSFATSLTQIEEGVRRIRDWVEKLKI